MPAFVLNDETKKNSHGFYLLNAGGQFDRFRENPVMLFNHDHDRLIGKWDNLHVEGSLLMLDPVFDEGDEDALKIKGKVDRGFLKGGSPGIIVLDAEYRDNPTSGSFDIFVTQWELFEGSVVSIPSNAGALSLKVYDWDHKLLQPEQVLSFIDQVVKLSAGTSNGGNPQNQKKEKPMEKVKLSAEALVSLGLNDDSDAAAISAAVLSLKAKLDGANAENTTLKASAEEARKKGAEEMVSLAITQGKITADKKEVFVKLALADLDTTKATLEAIPAKQSLSAIVQAGKKDQTEGRESWTYLKWAKEDPAGLANLRATDPTAFAELQKKR
jgi:HK97 family phage prohead protease